jgi:hypothetical protein
MPLSNAERQERHRRKRVKQKAQVVELLDHVQEKIQKGDMSDFVLCALIETAKVQVEKL